jgi:hypothetical protein
MTTVVTKIGDREAIPVRAVSFITHHQIDALALAGLLYENDLYYDGLAKVEKADIHHAQLKKGTRTLYAFCVNGGEIKKIKSVYWHDVFFDLKAIRENLRAFDAKHKTNSRQEFRKKSLKRLPAGIFLWRDDFEKVWGGLVAEDSADDNECETSFINETEGVRLIDYSPEMESKEIALAVMEGFDVSPAFAVADTPVQKKEKVYLRDLHYLVGHHGMPDLTHCNSSKYSVLGFSIDEKGIYPDESREFKDFVNGLLPAEADVLLHQMLPKDYVYAPGKPLLTFPCSITALRRVLDAIGEAGMIIDERGSEYLEDDESDLDPETSVPARQTKVGRPRKHEQRVAFISDVVEAACASGLEIHSDEMPGTKIGFLEALRRVERELGTGQLFACGHGSKEMGLALKAAGCHWSPGPKADAGYWHQACPQLLAKIHLKNFRRKLGDTPSVL